ncbi:MAG: TIGR04282 family arsenosugar biosynthesis glycosyltransferase [Synergistaceae bacterium]|jgi:rSAM/selenodomain-associated transferase 1|nr:TIGR04282 family arsenosugar biosynthesis glycosyltransferase [Synergistaceae bacterium]
MNENALIFFTRIPVPGQCKTRLIPFLGAEAACALQLAFIADVSAELCETETPCDLVVCFEPSGRRKILESLIAGNARYMPQSGANLGERMHRAFVEIFSLGYRKALLFGSDLPLLRAAAVDRAFASLDDYDCVLLPTFDGGYGLIGLKEPDASLFNLDYDAFSVTEETRKALARVGKTCALLPPALDVDDREDLLRLQSSLLSEARNVCPKTRKILAGLLLRQIQPNEKPPHDLSLPRETRK